MKIVSVTNAVCARNVVLNGLNSIAGSLAMSCHSTIVVMATKSTIKTVTCRNQAAVNNGTKSIMTIF
ncbi:hypothetical protein D3C75_1350640 [compost metagenome]